MPNQKITCIDCGSHEVRLDEGLEFYKCEHCGVIWDDDDLKPDDWGSCLETSVLEEIKNEIGIDKFERLMLED
jgi:uncharacterized Zn finger protein